MVQKLTKVKLILPLFLILSACGQVKPDPECPINTVYNSQVASDKFGQCIPITDPLLKPKSGFWRELKNSVEKD